MRNLRLLAIGTVTLAIVLVLLLQPANRSVSTTKCGIYRNDKAVSIGSEKIQAETAKTPAERQKGLGGRVCIEPDKGMLFVFDHPGHYAFWMKDMNFPIDIIWLDSSHQVVGLETNVKPSTYPDRFANKQKLAQYVLELKAGRADNLRIGLGTAVNF
jgi:uncharacterized membrane protein (UPF0127 family)